MEHTEQFKKLIEKSIENNQYLGLGNPDAKILFVGKEPGAKINSGITHGGARSWKDGNDYSERFPAEGKIKNGRHTWQKYQKLYELVMAKLNIKIVPEKKDHEITFVENVFTTELNDLSAPTSDEAKKLDGFEEGLQKRKNDFFKDDFIKSFPIVVITATDNKYIETYQGEVCDLFGVKFYEQITCGKSNKIWVHYAEEKNETYPKLVLHTRQFTNGATNELLEKISNILSDFVNEHSIKIKVK